ncbi:hypothetical protein GW932_05415, partial [archaeon]|nr:hypothetical protein [archaeon]
KYREDNKRRLKIISKEELRKQGVVSPDAFDCYDKETEVLTKKGFKLFKDVIKDDLIATLNSKEELEYQKPTKIIRQDYSGEMFEIKNRQVDLLVTPNHKLYVNTGDERFGKFKLKTAEEIKGMPYTLKKNCKWVGIEKKYFYLPSINEKKNKFARKYKKEKVRIKMDDWLEFLGYYLSEGWSGQNRVVVAQKVGTKTWGKMRDCFDRLGLNCKNYNCDKNLFVFQNRQLMVYLKRFGKSYQKFIPEEIKELSSRQLRILFNALMDGDGCRSQYWTVSKLLRDDMIEIALKIGLSASWYIKHKKGKEWFHRDGRARKAKYDLYGLIFSGYVGLKNGLTPTINHHKKWGVRDKWVKYVGKIYCVTVPNHIIYV